MGKPIKQWKLVKGVLSAAQRVSSALNVNPLSPVAATGAVQGDSSCGSGLGSNCSSPVTRADQYFLIKDDIYRGKHRSLFTRCWLLQQRAQSWAENAEKSLHQQLENKCPWKHKLALQIFQHFFFLPTIFLPLLHTLSVRYCSCCSYLCTTSSLSSDQAAHCCASQTSAAWLPWVQLLSDSVWFSC